MNSTDHSAHTADQLDAKRDEIIEALTKRQFDLHPELDKKYGPIGRIRCKEDNGYHLRYLSEALRAGMTSLFSDYIAWAKIMLASRGVPAEDLAHNMQLLQVVIREHLSHDAGAITGDYIRKALDQLPAIPETTPSHLNSATVNGALANRYLQFLLNGNRHEASRMILDAVERGVPLREIYLDVFQASQWEIGRLWQENKLSVAQEHYCTAATQLIMSQLYPHIFSGKKSGRSMVATCVSGDLHEIGIRMISDFFEMEGWDTYYLGANVPPPSIIASILARNADLLAISATMTYHVQHVTELIRAVRNNLKTAQTKILVGGYPFNLEPSLWINVGADACARDAASSVELANRLISEVAR